MGTRRCGPGSRRGGTMMFGVGSSDSLRGRHSRAVRPALAWRPDRIDLEARQLPGTLVAAARPAAPRDESGDPASVINQLPVASLHLLTRLGKITELLDG